MNGWEFVYFTNQTEIRVSSTDMFTKPLFCLRKAGCYDFWYISAKELYLLFTAYVNELPLPSTIRLFRDTDLTDGLQFAVHTENMLLVLNGATTTHDIILFRIWDNAANKAILIYKEIYGG